MKKHEELPKAVEKTIDHFLALSYYDTVIFSDPDSYKLLGLGINS